MGSISFPSHLIVRIIYCSVLNWMSQIVYLTSHYLYSNNIIRCTWSSIGAFKLLYRWILCPLLTTITCCSFLLLFPLIASWMINSITKMYKFPPCAIHPVSTNTYPIDTLLISNRILIGSQIAVTHLFLLLMMISTCVLLLGWCKMKTFLP